MRLTAALGAALFATTVATSASADPSAPDWGRVLTELDVIARKGTDVLDTPRCTAAGCFVETNAAALHPSERHGELNVQNVGNAWFGVAPRVSLVARDWFNAYKVAGDRLSIADAMRLSASTRMVLSRVRLNQARFTPFAQVGFGQWRTDTDLLPHFRREMEVAAQIGGGFELRITRAWQMAFESTTTALYREVHGQGDIPALRMWSTMVASRLEF
ncbi:MAG: hypothetical protein KF819_22130 [Labilithrix sp.]|nr:hypothetical protein [Labilithrix sp.]